MDVATREGESNPSQAGKTSVGRDKDQQQRESNEEEEQERVCIRKQKKQ